MKAACDSFYRCMSQQYSKFILAYCFGVICTIIFFSLNGNQFTDFDDFLNNDGKSLTQSKHWDEKDLETHKGEDVVAKNLAKKVRIFCAIMTHPKAHKEKAIHIKATWAQHCNGYVFLSSIEDPTLPSVISQDQNAEHHDDLWPKAKTMINIAHEKMEKNEIDYLFKADDDTYAIPENLRFMLKDKSTDDPFLMGRHFKPIVKQGYPSGGGGYILSREAVKRIYKNLKIPDSICSKQRVGSEDFLMGRCAEGVGIPMVSSLDAIGRERFHPLPPISMLHKELWPAWLPTYDQYEIKAGLDCCSDLSTSFHYIKPMDMYLLEYMVYHLHPYGIRHYIADD